MRVNSATAVVGPSVPKPVAAAVSSIDRIAELATSTEALTRVRGVAPVPARADYHSGGSRHDARRDAATPAAAMLADLIHRMGGANTSAARGAYVNLRV